MYKFCDECGKEFKCLMYPQIKYCSERCKKEVAYRRKRVKIAESLKTGLINGRPLWEDIFLRYKKGADAKGLDFELSKDYFRDNFAGDCYYCGDKMPKIGIDRIDSSKGYIKSNVVICCTECNLMKRGMSQRDFIEQCKKIAKRH